MTKRSAGPPSVCNQEEACEVGGSEFLAGWARICGVDEIPRPGARVVRRANGPNVAVFRTAADCFFALDDRCPHRGGPLSQGIVHGDRVACPLHNTRVDLPSGCAVAPDKGRVRKFCVKVEAGVIYVDLEEHGNATDRLREIP